MDSGSIEQDADIVSFLYKEKGQDPEDTLVEMIIAKFRNGQTGSLAFEWHGTNFKFVATDSERLKYIKKAPPKESDKDGDGSGSSGGEGGEQ